MSTNKNKGVNTHYGSRKLRTILQIGETIAVEFKRCSNRIENDVYQSVCSFLNRFGGDIYLGVEDDGTVCGVPENAAGDMVKNFIKIISNPNMFYSQSISIARNYKL